MRFNCKSAWCWHCWCSRLRLRLCLCSVYTQCNDFFFQPNIVANKTSIFSSRYYVVVAISSRNPNLKSSFFFLSFLKSHNLLQIKRIVASETKTKKTLINSNVWLLKKSKLFFVDVLACYKLLVTFILENTNWESTQIESIHITLTVATDISQNLFKVALETLFKSWIAMQTKMIARISDQNQTTKMCPFMWWRVFFSLSSFG